VICSRFLARIGDIVLHVLDEIRPGAHLATNIVVSTSQKLADTDISATFTEPGSLALKFTPSKGTDAVVVMGINAGTPAENVIETITWPPTYMNCASTPFRNRLTASSFFTVVIQFATWSRSGTGGPAAAAA